MKLKRTYLLHSIQNESAKTRTYWRRGVLAYAYELIEGLDSGTIISKKALLNGADNWGAYSWGGCSLIYDCDIAERTSTPSELKKTKGGERQPNKCEQWLDVQARALFQASCYLLKKYDGVTIED